MCSKLPEYGANNQIDVLMRGGLSPGWQAPLSLPFHPSPLTPPAAPTSAAPLRLHLHRCFISFTFSFARRLLSRVYLRLVICLPLRISNSLPLSHSPNSPRCHWSLAPCLSVILRLIAIDHRRSHMSTNLIKSDKRWYFYRRICKQTPPGRTRARQKINK